MGVGEFLLAVRGYSDGNQRMSLPIIGSTELLEQQLDPFPAFSAKRGIRPGRESFTEDHKDHKDLGNDPFRSSEAVGPLNIEA